MTESVSIEWRDKIALVWIDNPPVNAAAFHVRSGIVDNVEKAAEDGAEAIVLVGRGGTFIAGADIKEFGKPPIDPMLYEVCDSIEASTVPVVALVEGNTLGGGLEVALGAHYRIATPQAKLGFPEVNIGVLPGAGGTQRTPRLLPNLSDAITMVASGRPVSGKAALEMGLVDRLVEGDPITDAISFAQEIAGKDFEARRLSKINLEMNDEIAATFDAAMAQVEKQAKGAIAPKRAAECARNAFTMSFEDGMKAERQGFMDLVAGDQSKALRHIFFAERAAAKAPADVSGTPREIKKVGVIGAGTMGGGISMTYIEAGFPVVLLEMSDEALDRGLGVIEKNWARGIKSGRTTAEQVAERMSRYTRTTDYNDLADCDLIIEAVFETMDIKRDVFRKLDKIAKPGAILASNTSYLDVDAIAAETSRPQDVLGMHYFSPANIMKLLEIVRAEKTADDVLLTALAMAKKTRKQPAVARVGHGFIGNRMLTPYLRQANLLVLEGASPEQVDKALTDFGWAMGCFAVSDLAGLDIGYKSRKDQNLTDDEKRVYTIADRLVEAGHLGQKSGSGFYQYDPETRARSENPEATRIINEVRAELGINTRAISDEEIIERTQFALANEGAHVLAEGVAQRASDIDVVYNYGYGYPRWRGGPMHYVETVGLKKVGAKLIEWFQGSGGVHWEPSDLLMELAHTGESFADWEKEKERMSTLFDMAGKTAIITGSSRGIGKAIAERMAEHGARVVISSRNQDVCETTAAEINKSYGEGTAIAVAANISSKDDLQNLVDKTRKAFGKIHVLVCNAASNPYYGPLADITDDAFTKIMQNNVISNNWLIGMVSPEMVERKDGAIIIVSSIGGLKGSPIIGAYNISKAADFQLARNLCAELGPSNVRVNCIAPGLIKTDFAKALWENPENLKPHLSRTPMNRIGEPDEIAGAAVFLASAAGNYVNGQKIIVDGGTTIA